MEHVLQGLYGVDAPYLQPFSRYTR